MKRHLFSIGTYTEAQDHVSGACGMGIIIVALDNDSGELIVLSVERSIRNPSWIHWDLNRMKLYAVTENPEDDGEIVSYSLRNGSVLEELGRTDGPGRAGCHLLPLSLSERLFSVSYLDGIIKGFELSNGIPDNEIYTRRYSGRGINILRQESAHAHQICTDLAERFLYVCDLGSDVIWMHDIGNSVLKVRQALKTADGYGPRHMVFDTDSPIAYILCELYPVVIVSELKPDGTLSILEQVYTVTEKDRDRAAPSAIKVHPTGQTLCVSNRFVDTVAIFHINKKNRTSRLSKITEFSTKGKTPRDITFSSCGKWLLIANQDSNDIQICRFDNITGYPLDLWGPSCDIGSPSCIVPVV